MSKVMVSLSNDPTETDNMLAALSVFALSLSEESLNVSSLIPSLHDYLKASTPALKRFGLMPALKEAVHSFKENKYKFHDGMGKTLSKAMALALPKVKADHVGVSASQLNLYNKLKIHFSKESESAWKYIVSNVKLLKKPAVTTAYVSSLDATAPKLDTSTVDLSEMKRLTKLITGRSNDYIIAPLEFTRVTEKNPDNKKLANLIAEYRALYKSFNTAFKHALMRLVRSSGKDLIDVKIAREKLKAQGLNNIPDGFVGLVNEDAIYFTSKGHKLGGMVGAVVMNPLYDDATDNTYACRAKYAVSIQNRPMEWRSTRLITSKTTQRFEAVKKTADKIKVLRKKWAADLAEGDAKTQAMAALIDVAYMTLARVGGVGNKTEEGEATYGLSTLMVEHVKFDSNGSVEFNYAGKKGTMQPAVYHPTTIVEKNAIKIIKRLARGKKPTDPLFTYNGKIIPGTAINAYLKGLGVEPGFTIHKFRHLFGTAKFLELTKECPFKKGDPKTTQSGVEKWYKEALLPIGDALHHRTGEKVTAMTALNSYVDVFLQLEFFKNLGLRNPSFLEKKTKHGSVDVSKRSK